MPAGPFGSYVAPQGGGGGGGTIIVNSGALSSGAVTSGYPGNNSINSGSITPNVIGIIHIASGGLGSGAIGSGQVAKLHIVSGGLSSGAIGSGSLAGFELGSGSIVSGRIASGQIGNNHLSADSIWSGHVGSGAVVGSYGSGRNIASGSIGGFDLASGVGTGGGGTPGGSSGQVQFNAGGSFGGLSTSVTPDGTVLALTSPRVITGINDTNGNELIKVTATGSAVNEITIANAATGNPPVISATGGDANINILLTPKGTGDVCLSSDVQIVSLTGNQAFTPLQQSGNGGWGIGLLGNGESRISVGPDGIGLGSALLIWWTNSALDGNTTRDTGFYRSAAGVVEVNAGAAGTLAWITSTGHPRLASNVTNATATMANLTELSVTLKAGRKYTFKCVLFVEEDVAADGVKIDFDGGTATMTSFRAHALIFDTALLASLSTTAIATDLNTATITGPGMIEVHGAFVVNAAGTFIPRAAQAAHTTGTLTVYLNSFLVVEEANN